MPVNLRNRSFLTLLDFTSEEDLKKGAFRIHKFFGLQLQQWWEGHEEVSIVENSMLFFKKNTSLIFLSFGEAHKPNLGIPQFIKCFKIYQARLGLEELPISYYSTYAEQHNLVTQKEEKLSDETSISKVNEEVYGLEKTYMGNIDEGTVFMGQSAGLIDRIESVSEIINAIVNDAEKCLTDAYNTIKKIPIAQLI